MQLSDQIASGAIPREVAFARIKAEKEKNKFEHGKNPDLSSRVDDVANQVLPDSYPTISQREIEELEQAPLSFETDVRFAASPSSERPPMKVLAADLSNQARAPRETANRKITELDLPTEDNFFSIDNERKIIVVALLVAGIFTWVVSLIVIPISLPIGLACLSLSATFAGFAFFPGFFDTSTQKNVRLFPQFTPHLKTGPSALLDAMNLHLSGDPRFDIRHLEETLNNFMNFRSDYYQSLKTPYPLLQALVDYANTLSEPPSFVIVVYDEKKRQITYATAGQEDSLSKIYHLSYIDKQWFALI